MHESLEVVGAILPDAEVIQPEVIILRTNITEDDSTRIAPQNCHLNLKYEVTEVGFIGNAVVKTMRIWLYDVKDSVREGTIRPCCLVTRLPRKRCAVMAQWVIEH